MVAQPNCRRPVERQGREEVMRIVGIGRPKTHVIDGREVVTAIFKERIAGPVAVSLLNIEGDEQADLSSTAAATRPCAPIRRITTRRGARSSRRMSPALLFSGRRSKHVRIRSLLSGSRAGRRSPNEW